jgi:hypothetical protein
MPDYTPNFSGVIDALKTIIQTGIGSGGGGGSGDASAANQQIEIASLTSINSKTTLISDRIPTLGAKTASQSIPVTLSSDGAFSINFGATTDTAATTDTGTFSFLAFVKRLLSIKLDIALSAISNKLPTALVSDRIKTNTIGASLDLSGSASAVNADAIAATDVSDYKT